MRGVNGSASRALAVSASLLGASWSVLLAAAVTLGACESATNLAVSYDDASAATGSGSASDAGRDGDDVDARVDGSAADGSTPITPTLTGCPCDPTQGLGCCMPAADKPFCTGDVASCTSTKGTLLKCLRPDPTTESQCCWHGSGTGAVTALAAFCDGGPVACTADTDCAGTGETKCALASCLGGSIVIGACGSVPPTCPQP